MREQEIEKGHQIYELIPKVMADIGAVSKDRKNEQQKYSFRGIEDFYKAAHPALIRHGVFCVPEVIGHEVSTHEKTNDQGRVTLWRHVTVTVKHQFFAPDGSHVDAITMGEGLDNSDKATNKAMSGAMKYALIELFSVPTEDVEDGDRTSPEAGRNKPVKRTDKDIDIAGPTQSSAVTTVKGTAKTGESNGGQAVVAAVTEVAGPTSKPAIETTEYSTREQQDFMRLRFEDSIPVKYVANADNLRREWLKKEGYVNAAGVGTSKAIPRALFNAVHKQLMAHARTIAELSK